MNTVDTHIDNNDILFLDNALRQTQSNIEIKDSGLCDMQLSAARKLRQVRIALTILQRTILFLKHNVFNTFIIMYIDFICKSKTFYWRDEVKELGTIVYELDEAAYT